MFLKRTILFFPIFIFSLFLFSEVKAATKTYDCSNNNGKGFGCGSNIYFCTGIGNEADLSANCRVSSAINFNCTDVGTVSTTTPNGVLTIDSCGVYDSCDTASNYQKCGSHPNISCKLRQTNCTNIDCNNSNSNNCLSCSSSATLCNGNCIAKLTGCSAMSCTDTNKCTGCNSGYALCTIGSPGALYNTCIANSNTHCATFTGTDTTNCVNNSTIGRCATCESGYTRCTAAGGVNPENSCIATNNTCSAQGRTFDACTNLCTGTANPLKLSYDSLGTGGALFNSALSVPAITALSSGEVGLGILAPSTKLHLFDSISGPIISLSGTTTANYSGLRFANTSNTEKFFTGLNNSNNFVLRHSDAYDLFSASSTEARIGIGSNFPPQRNYELAINGKLSLQGALAELSIPILNTSGTDKIMMINTSGVLYATSSSIATGLPTGTVGQTLYANASNAWTASSFLYNNGNNIGIGTNNPLNKLDVSGNVGIFGSLSVPTIANNGVGSIFFGPNNAITWSISSGAFSNNTAVAPDSSNTAATLTLTTGNGSHWDLVKTFSGLTAGTSYTITLYVKLGTATNFGLVVNDTTSWNTIGGKMFTASDGLSNSTWKEISYTFIEPAGKTGINIHLGANQETILNSFPQTAGTAYIWGLKIVKNTPSSLILQPNSGNVGIGTTTPAAKLQVNISSAGDGFRVVGSSTYSPQFSLYKDTTQLGAVGLSLSAGHYSALAVANDVVLRALGAGSAGNLILTTQNATGNIYFGTGSTSQNDTAKMTILNNGNIGIGTSTPASKLHLFDSTSGPVFSISGLTGTGPSPSGNNNYRGIAIKDTNNNEKIFYGLDSDNNFVLRPFYFSTSTNIFAASTSAASIAIGVNFPPIANTQLAIDGKLRVYGEAGSVVIDSLKSATVGTDEVITINSDGQLNSVAASSGVGKFVGVSTNVYLGDNTGTGGGTPGYAAAHNICSSTPGILASHVCTNFEILNSIKDGITMPNENLWFFNGPPGYTESANDCEGRTKASATSYGTYWEKPGAAPQGRGFLGSCYAGGVGLKFACCK